MKTLVTIWPLIGHCFLKYKQLALLVDENRCKVNFVVGIKVIHVVSAYVPQGRLEKGIIGNFGRSG